MEVLITDRRAKSQLSILLRELGYLASFHESAESLQNSLVLNPAGRPVLVDLGAELDHEGLLSKYKAVPGMRFIGLHFFSSSQDAAIHLHAKLYTDTIVLPEHAERAKSRLKHSLMPRASLMPKAGPNSSGSRHPYPSAQRSFSPRLKSRPPFAFKKEVKKELNSFRDGARYLACRSEVAKDLLFQIQRLSRSEKLAHLLIGEDGAEFELVCREINFQTISDRTPLHMIAPDDISIDALEKLERAASRDRTILHVFVGSSDDYNAEALRQLGLFIDYLGNLRNPHLRIYLAHAVGSEEFFREGVDEVLKSLSAKLETLRLPTLGDRAEDISEICHTTIGSLRAAHPFLVVQRITNEAIDHLVATRGELSHQKLIRIIRNSIALCRKEVLGAEDIKNYGESDMTTQHLLESMADESFFPAEQSANF